MYSVFVLCKQGCLLKSHTLSELVLFFQSAIAKAVPRMTSASSEVSSGDTALDLNAYLPREIFAEMWDIIP